MTDICDGPDLPPFFSRWDTVWRHVESHAAATIRRMGGDRHLILLVSREPCDNDPAGCEIALPKILPRGSSLTIFVAKPGAEPKFYGTYDGTGEGLK